VPDVESEAVVLDEIDSLDDMIDDERFVFVRLKERDVERRDEKSKRAPTVRFLKANHCVSQSVKNIQIQLWSRIGTSFDIIALLQPK
jgi:hypothetical protein